MNLDKRIMKYIGIGCAHLLIIATISMIGVWVGAIHIPFDHFFELSNIEKTIIFSLRVPRLICAFLVGGMLALAGVSFQGALQNPLADPYILGVSAGGALGVSLVYLLGIHQSSVIVIPIAAFLGAVGSMMLLEMLIRYARAAIATHYILAGIIINAFLSSVMLLVMFLAKKRLQAIMFWLMGDVGKSGISIALWMALLLIPIGIVLYRYADRLNILALGDDVAHSLGVRPQKVRKTVLYLASLLTGMSVAIGGIIGFVGLVIPHMMRLAFSHDYRVLMPLSFFWGGAFLMSTDTLSRWVFPSLELPIGVITAFIGAPFFMFLFIHYLKTHNQ